MKTSVIFLLDNDKDLLNLYGTLLKDKGCQVFATDNLFLLMKYAKNTSPKWIFIDENFAKIHESEILKLINDHLPLTRTRYAIMSKIKARKNKKIFPNIEFVYKPKVMEKMLQVSEKSCNLP